MVCFGISLISRVFTDLISLYNSFCESRLISSLDFDNDGKIRAKDIKELVNRITGITGRHKLEGADAERNQLSEGEGSEMEKVIKHVSKIAEMRL